MTPGNAESRARHLWRFDGDDPYIICKCGERRDVLSRRVITAGDGSHVDSRETVKGSRCANTPTPPDQPVRRRSDMADATSKWGARAERLLEQALSETRDGIDAIPTVDAALTVLRIEAGEVPADAMDGYPFPGEDDSDAGCTCPPDLVARGGWSSQCPAHGGLHA